MPRTLFRFAPILCAMLLSMLAPATAATISFSTESTSEIEHHCTSFGQNETCNIDEAEIKFRAADDRLLDPSATFRFLKFEAKGTEKRGDSFSTTATLAFKLASLPKVHKVTSTGTGSFATKGGDFTRFSILWAPIVNVFVQGLGIFSVSFEDRNLTGIKDDDVYIHATMTQVSAVPLPAGAWLLLSGLAVLGAARLRRRAVA